MTTQPSHTHVTSSRKDLLLEALFDLLPDDDFEAIEDLPTSSLLLVKNWLKSEELRLSPYMSRVVGGAQNSNPNINELIDLASAEKIDMQSISSWLGKHRNTLTAQELLQLVSAAMGRGVVKLMSSRGKKKRENTTIKLQKIGQRWLQLQAKGYNKSKAANVIAPEVNLELMTVYRHLTNGLDSNKRIFPEGIEQAKKDLGL